MIILNVFLSIKPEEESNFLAFAQELVTKSRGEEGNIMYNLYKQTDGDGLYFLCERWKDADAIKFHNATEHYQQFSAKIGDFAAAPVDIQRYTV